ncbi:hypothetical protein [Streptomyces wuyuanensis]|uniref:hypothetical protein n=1 Tax=Streptomyces wuyuanensis TaxID=1196353 RepID=UPI003413B6FD
MTSSSAETTPSGPEVLAFHWLMTVQAEGVSTLSNTIHVPAGTSRSHVYSRIRAHVAQQIGCSDFPVLFFALEPDRL